MVLKPGARARRFTAHEDLATDRVSFVWLAKFPMFGPISLRVTDSYQDENGLLEGRLGRLPLQRKREPELSRGEAFRYLAELAWAPQAILANRALEWVEVDESTRWVGEYRDYRDFGGVVMPTRGEVRWELSTGPFTYWRAAITSFELCN